MRAQHWYWCMWQAEVTLYMQVAFGTDFSKDQYVQSLAGDKGLTYLMSHCLEGLMKILINPLLMVTRCMQAN